MVAENTKKTPQESASVQPATKHATPKKPTTTTPVKQSKPAPPPTKKPSKRKLPQKVRKGKPTFQLVDEDDEAQQDDDPDLDRAKKMSLEALQEKGEGEGDDADLERAIKLSLDPAFLPQGRAPVGGVTIRDPVSETTSKLHEVVGKGKAVVTEEQVAHSLINLSKKKRTTDQFILVRRDQTPPDSTTGPSSQPDDDTSEKVIHESSSTSDSERTESETEAAAPKGDKDQDDVDTSTVTSGVSIPVSDPEQAHEALAGPDPEPMKEDQTGSDSGKLHVSLAGPNPEHMDDEFLATAYPKVHENLKLITDERVIDDKPENVSSSKPSLLVTPPPINTEAMQQSPQILPEITSIHRPSAKSGKIGTRMSKLFDNYLGQHLMNALLKVLERHTADLIEKYSVLPGPESVKNQESEKSPRAIDYQSQKGNKTRLKTTKESMIVDEMKMMIDDRRPLSADQTRDEGNDLRREEDTGQRSHSQGMHTPQEERVKGCRRKTSFKGRRMIFGRDLQQDGSAEQNMKERKLLQRADLEGPTFNLEYLRVIKFLRNIYEPLPLGGPPGQVTIQPQFFFNKDLEYLLTGDKERKIALSISKLKAARYLDFGLEELVPSLSQMRILSVISVKVFEKYGYNYLREIILRRADYQEYKISEKDFKNLHPNDFEDLFLLNIQEKLNHLPKTDKTSLHTAVNMWIRNLVIRNRVGDLQLGIESYQTKINLERPNWDAC
ncbi:hypothetical protein Tco_1502563 [Tanacetum coccineum]